MGYIRKSGYFENEFVRIQLLDGVIHVNHVPNTIITLDMAKTMVNERLRISNGITRPVLGDAREIVAADRKARAFLARDKKSIMHISAIGILIKDRLQQFLGNIFLKIDRPVAPSRLFTEQAKALQWLEQYKTIL